MDETALKSALYSWLSQAMGKQHVFTITFDADFISGNVINGSFDGEAIDPVSFDTDHATTLSALAAEIQKRAEIFKAAVSGARRITVTGLLNGDTISVVGPTVTGGAIQPTASVATVQAADSVPVIFADQNAPRPLYPYAVLRLDSLRSLGMDELREMDDEGIALYGGQRVMTVSVEVFGPGSADNAMQAFHTLEKKSVAEALAASGIAILEKNPVQNLTAMLETKFEGRAVFDIFIGLSDNFEDDIGVIEKVELTGEYTGAVDGPIIIGPRIIDAS